MYDGWGACVVHTGLNSSSHRAYNEKSVHIQSFSDFKVMDTKKVTHVMISIPNMGYTQVEAYGNRLMNFMKMGQLQRDRNYKNLLKDKLPKEELDRIFGVEDEEFMFYF